jgi:hypothetical protein
MIASRTAIRALVPLILLGISVSSPAHHSFAAVFDVNVTVEVNGTVTDVEWMNPHAWIHLDVENAGGDIERWSFELGSPNGLIRRGWSRATIQPGDVISISGYRARDGSRRGNVVGVTLASGQRLDGMSSRPKAE